MAPPRMLWLIEWSAARKYDRPAQRTDRERVFRYERVAARQVASVRKWEATHTELRAVWRTCGADDRGVQWERLDAEQIDALVAVIGDDDDPLDDLYPQPPGEGP